MCGCAGWLGARTDRLSGREPAGEGRVGGGKAWRGEGRRQGRAAGDSRSRAKREESQAGIQGVRDATNCSPSCLPGPAHVSASDQPQTLTAAGRTLEARPIQRAAASLACAADGIPTEYIRLHLRCAVSVSVSVSSSSDFPTFDLVEKEDRTSLTLSTTTTPVVTDRQTSSLPPHLGPHRGPDLKRRPHPIPSQPGTPHHTTAPQLEPPSHPRSARVSPSRAREPQPEK